MPTVTVTFVKATFVLATFVHIRNVSAVTDPILTKRLGPNFWQALTFLIEIFLGPYKFFGPTILWTQNLWTQNFVWTFFSNKFFWTQIFYDINIFWTPIFLDLKYLPTQNFVKPNFFWVHKFFVTNKIFLGPKFFSFFFNVKLKSNFTKIYKNEVYHRLGIWYKDLTHHPWNGHPPSQGYSPTIPMLFTHHPKDSQPSNSTRSLTLAQPSLFSMCFVPVLYFDE